MATMATVRHDYSESAPRSEAYSSGVSWAAVFAGAFVTGALSLILMTLGAGIGLSSISPWPNAGMSASRVGSGAIIWLILVEILASAVGGYLAGRLRTKWVSVHTHEVYFRDTAHGFLVWAVSLVITSLFFASYATSIAAADRGRAMVSNGSEIAVGNGYFVDSLFRSDHPRSDRNDVALRNEAAIILANALRQSEMPAQDKTYLTQLVSASTGLSQSEAEKRVSDTVVADREAADTARKAAAHSLYWLFVALLIGAFCASYSATIGGRQRDHIRV